MERPRRDVELELELAEAKWRLRALDEWRKDVEKRLSGCVERLDGLTKSDEIAEAVAAKMRSERVLQLTWAQKAVAGVVGAVAFADAIRGLVGA